MKREIRKNKAEQNTEKLDEKISHRINELEQEKIILIQLNKYLEGEKFSFDDFVSTISDMALNPIVPITAYVDMLLAGYFGELNKKQKEKLTVIKDSTVLLKKRLTSTKIPKKSQYF
jgi:light-regulated signal transduction histidine kinase (bacteriophytochrome)